MEHINIYLSSVSNAFAKLFNQLAQETLTCLKSQLEGTSRGLILQPNWHLRELFIHGKSALKKSTIEFGRMLTHRSSSSIYPGRLFYQDLKSRKAPATGTKLPLKQSGLQWSSNIHEHQITIDKSSKNSLNVSNVSTNQPTNQTNPTNQFDNQPIVENQPILTNTQTFQSPKIPTTSPPPGFQPLRLQDAHHNG